MKKKKLYICIFN